MQFLSLLLVGAFVDLYVCRIEDQQSGYSQEEKRQACKQIPCIFEAGSADESLALPSLVEDYEAKDAAPCNRGDEIYLTKMWLPLWHTVHVNNVIMARMLKLIILFVLHHSFGSQVLAKAAQHCRCFSNYCKRSEIS